MGGRSGQSVRVSGVNTISYSLSTKNETGVNTTNIPTDKLIEMAGVPKDFQGEIKIKHRDNGSTRIEVEHDGLTMWRVIDADRKFVRNSLFEIQDTSKYKGKGYKMFEQQVNALREQKFKEIETNAARGTTYNGYYTWARFGYQPFDTSIDFVGKINAKHGTQFKSWYEMMNTATGQKLWKKDGVEFAGVFDLSDNSLSMKTWKNYLKYRKLQS